MRTLFNSPYCPSVTAVLSPFPTTPCPQSRLCAHCTVTMAPDRERDRKKKPPSLLHLPGEIRNKIYHQIAKTKRGRLPRNDNSFLRRSKRLISTDLPFSNAVAGVALLRTCRQINFEFRPILYAMQFGITANLSSCDFLMAAPAEFFTRLRITFQYTSSCPGPQPAPAAAPSMHNAITGCNCGVPRDQQSVLRFVDTAVARCTGIEELWIQGDLCYLARIDSGNGTRKATRSHRDEFARQLAARVKAMRKLKVLKINHGLAKDVRFATRLAHELNGFVEVKTVTGKYGDTEVVVRGKRVRNRTRC
ncbi:hypothetical protein QBC34DRAFT_143807 [Podospora aff. communis PSN243]|uniref:Uncharacterized protein n=1 Tax=Podospora aff. communis PSN243 TaxID=3040156 RepID=A0AAV9GG80_9PEZI|nr:hypothetical protein QBC34DRAFT_143807 [Podospora aff. communis PSN243]